MKPTRNLLASLLLGFLLSACGGEEGASDGASAVDPATGLTAEQLEKGLGPISEIRLGPIDTALAATGEEIFTVKCTACHKLGERYVGPDLGEVLDRRAPEYIMNMMLNPDEMVQRHPEAKALLAQFMTPMPNQQLTQYDARAVLEYLRQAADSTE